MRLRLGDKMVMALCGFLYGLFGLVAIAAILLNWLDPQTFHNIGDILASWVFRYKFVVSLVVVVILVGLWVGSIHLFRLAFKRTPKSDNTSVSIQDSVEGEVRISISALNTLIAQAIGSRDEIVELETKVINHDDAITVKVSMVLKSSTHIPNLTLLLQRSIKNYVEEYSGITVREVRILISELEEDERLIAPVDAIAAPVSVAFPVKPERVGEFENEVETTEFESSGEANEDQGDQAADAATKDMVTDEEKLTQE